MTPAQNRIARRLMRDRRSDPRRDRKVTRSALRTVRSH